MAVPAQRDAIGGIHNRHDAIEVALFFIEKDRFLLNRQDMGGFNGELSGVAEYTLFLVAS
jgi:hypothetical protein